jgi:hypothetical protein
VKFAPHLTVCGVPGDLAVLDAAAFYVRRCGLLPLKVAKTAITGAVITPFRAVFIEVENSAELREFREQLRDIVSAPPLIPPHISLLYTLDRNSQTPRPDFRRRAAEGNRRRAYRSDRRRAFHSRRTRRQQRQRRRARCPQLECDALALVKD